MTKRLSPAVIVALKQALCSVYWYKKDLRSFLQSCLSSSAVLSTLNWENYKRQIVSDLIDYLCREQDKYIGELTRICSEVCNITSFKHLEQLDDGDKKAEDAKIAVNQLKELVEPHQNIQDEKNKIIERQKLMEEKLKQNVSVKENLEDISTRYKNLVLSKNPQGRGCELERVMYDLFKLFDLDPKASFRNIGEQIDGAFSLEGTEYLLEAKWTSERIGAKELDSFSSKIKRKLENTLGVFLSINGFTQEGVASHSSGKLVILLCDGSDLMAVLDGRIDFVRVVYRNVCKLC